MDKDANSVLKELIENWVEKWLKGITKSQSVKDEISVEEGHVEDVVKLL